MEKVDRRYLKLLVVGLWLTFSISLASWWIVFGLRQLDRIGLLETQQATELGRHQKMLMWEGGVLLLLLISGGIGLAYFVFQENKRYRQVKEFFATFSHELKTSIASLRLQVESLQEDFSNGSANIEDHHKNLLGRLMSDSVRLELQLENSLFLANVESQQLFVEELLLSRVLENLRPQWPGLDLRLDRDCIIRADRRAVESVLKNLIQNSAIHGQAKQVTFSTNINGKQVFVKIKDDGSGFKGNIKNLGKLFARHNSKSGSGVGLYLSQQLMKKMGGRLSFDDSQNGFLSELYFVGGEA